MTRTASFRGTGSLEMAGTRLVRLAEGSRASWKTSESERVLDGFNKFSIMWGQCS